MRLSVGDHFSCIAPWDSAATIHGVVVEVGAPGYWARLSERPFPHESLYYISNDEPGLQRTGNSAVLMYRVAAYHYVLGIGWWKSLRFAWKDLRREGVL